MEVLVLLLLAITLPDQEAFHNYSQRRPSGRAHMHIGQIQQRSLQRSLGQLRAAQGALAVAVHLAYCQASDCVQSKASLSGITETWDGTLTT